MSFWHSISCTFFLLVLSDLLESCFDSDSLSLDLPTVLKCFFSTTFITCLAKCRTISFPFTVVLSTVITLFLTFKVSMIIVSMITFEAFFNCFNWQSCGCYNPKQFSLGQLQLYLSGLIQTFYRVVCLIYFAKEMVLNLLIVDTKNKLVLRSSSASFLYLHSGNASLSLDMYESHVCEAFCFIFQNLNLANVWLDSSLNTFSSAWNTSSGLLISTSTDASIWVASLPSQFTNNPALCLSFRSHRGPSKIILQSALNFSSSVNLPQDSESNIGLESCRPPILAIFNQNKKYQ